jgi:hypothetical protein
MSSERWLSKRQAAEIAGVSEKTIDRAIKRRLLSKANNGVRRVLIAYSSLVRWMNGGKVVGC